ncbi:hypothetical protein AMS68_007371 [Peltaster fructicola]|uniref:Small ribosomal subunit protein uS11m n=1 Tax=Peltaster fructicola TaxID=286661 RepID=A0A6H0Y4B6_9PEZI|nr:hypothetical protein AMS68_007371 [Peltaster fructicola]
MSSARTLSSKSVCTACRHHLQLSRRSFTTAPVLRADEKDPFAALLAASTPSTRRPQPTSRVTPEAPQSPVMAALDDAQDATALWTSTASDNLNARNISQEAHRLNVYCTKHNTHITLVQPSKSAAQTISSSVSSTSSSAAAKNKVVDVLLSLSTGNIGFRKGGRGSYDAAYQLGAFAMKQIQEKGMLQDVRKLEVVLRGFGAGREAIQKILLGTEGRLLRRRITAVMDATRLKFGGDRSPNPRRLG